eukprot:UN24612
MVSPPKSCSFSFPGSSQSPLAGCLCERRRQYLLNSSNPQKSILFTQTNLAPNNLKILRKKSYKTQKKFFETISKSPKFFLTSFSNKNRNNFFLYEAELILDPL